MQEFNKGVYDYIIASDESAVRGEVDPEDQEAEVETDEKTPADEDGDDCKNVVTADRFILLINISFYSHVNTTRPCITSSR